MIELCDFSIGYAEKRLLDKVDASFKRGQLTALIGRNGTGKSTLLRAIAGLNRNYSGEILLADTELRRWFTAEQLAVMRDAVEDHRASSDHAPRTIYGRIVAEADRCIDPATVLRRTVQYGLSHCPALDREGHFERCLAHLRKKYAEGGYLRLWIPESDNARKQEELRALIRDEARLRAAFDAVFDQETAR